MSVTLYSISRDCSKPDAPRDNSNSIYHTESFIMKRLVSNSVYHTETFIMKRLVSKSVYHTETFIMKRLVSI